MGEEKNQITERSKTFLYFLFALILAVSFYSYEFFNDYSEEYYAAINKHTEEKKKRTKALEELKKLGEGTLEYSYYLERKKTTDLAYKNFNKVKENEKVFGFRSFYFFLERFGLWFGVFLYACFNLFRAFYFDKKNIGVKIIHSFIISVSMFYFFWIFQKFQDVSKITYYFATIISAIIVFVAVYYITKFNEHTRNRLKKQNLALAKIKIKKAAPEEEEKVLDEIEKIVRQD